MGTLGSPGPIPQWDSDVEVWYWLVESPINLHFAYMRASVVFKFACIFLILYILAQEGARFTDDYLL